LHKYIQDIDVPKFYEFHNKEQWPDFLAKLKEDPHDIGVVASFGHMIPGSVIDEFNPNGILILHPSLLPKYRGSCPI
jgi:methionyl-tRNA formyltransferase